MCTLPMSPRSSSTFSCSAFTDVTLPVTIVPTSIRAGLAPFFAEPSAEFLDAYKESVPNGSSNRSRSWGVSGSRWTDPRSLR